MTDHDTTDIDIISPRPRHDPDDAFRLYVAGGARSLRKVAITLGIPESTVMSWSRRYNWNARLRDLDSETLQGVAQSVVVATASMTLRALQTLGEVMADTEAKPADRVQASRVILDQYSRVAHLIPQLLPTPDDDAADAVEQVQTPQGAVELMRKHRESVGRR